MLDSLLPQAPLTLPVEQPIRSDYKEVDGVSVVSMFVHKAGTLIPQHSHEHSHQTVLAVGRIRAWKDREYLGEFTAPKQIVIEAHAKHTFEALSDGVLMLCIHNVSRTGEIEIAEEHQFG